MKTFQRAHRRRQHESGFTLIELLVVVVILIALAAIALPVMLNQKAKADDAAAQTLTSNIASALSIGIGTGAVTASNTDGTAPLTGVIVVGDPSGDGISRQSIPVSGSTSYVDVGNMTFCVSVQSPSTGTWFRYSTASPVTTVAAECTSATD